MSASRIHLTSERLEMSLTEPIAMSYMRLSDISNKLFFGVLRQLVKVNKLPKLFEWELGEHLAFYFKRSTQFLQFYNLSGRSDCFCRDHFNYLVREYGGPTERYFSADNGKAGYFSCVEFEKEAVEDDSRSRRTRVNEIQLVDMKMCLSMFKHFGNTILPLIKDSWGFIYDKDSKLVPNPTGKAMMDEFQTFFLGFTAKLFSDCEFDTNKYCDDYISAKQQAFAAPVVKAALEAEAEPEDGGADAKRTRTA